MKCSYILLFLFIAIQHVAFGQSIIITDEETGEPIPDVMLYVEQPKTLLVTDEKGMVDITELVGQLSIEVRKMGYRTEHVTYQQLAKPNFSLQLILTGVALKDVVVSASKFKEKQDHIAQKTQVIRSSELKNMNQTSMADVLANTGNIMVQKSQLGGGSPIIRGFETNKVLMVVDGVRMNNAIYRGGHLQNSITLDNSIMDRIELVYGPGSVVYGSDALGGVMHFYTKNPTLSRGDSIVIKGGAYARYFSAASGQAINGTISVGGQKIGSLTSFTYSNYSDLRQGANRDPRYPSFGVRNWYVDRINGVDSMLINADSNLQIGSAYQQYDFLQKFMFKQSEKITHLLNFQYSNSSDILRYDRLTQLSGGLPKYAEWYYGPQLRVLVSYNLMLNGKTKLYDHGKIILSYQNIEESRNTRRFKNDFLNHQIEKVGVYALNADFDKMINKQEIRYGLEATYNDVKSTAFEEDINNGTSSPSVTRYPDGGSNMRSLAFYTTHAWEINEYFILNDGVRITNVDLNAKFIDKSFFPFPFNSVNQNNTALNGNIGLVVNPAKTWRIALGLSTGFRAPNIDDISKVFESIPGTVIVPNPNLKTEYTYNAELSLSKTINKRATVSATGYYTLLKNAITVQNAQFNGQDSIIYDGLMSKVVSTVNAGEAYIYGIEGSFIGNLNEFLSMTGSINYTYGRIKTDSTDYPLDHIPPVFGKVSMNYQEGKFRSEFFVSFSGWKRLKDYNVQGEDNVANATTEGMPSWYTLNLRLNYQILKPLSLQVACENILDQNYRVFASNISAPGRNFIITLRYHL